MTIHYPHRCKKCNKISYSSSITKPPKTCCEGAELRELALICLLIPCPAGVEPVYTSKVAEPLISDSKAYSLACGAKKLPINYTDQPESCTCKGCRDYAEEYLSLSGWNLNQDSSPPGNEDEVDDLQNMDIRISLDQDPPNPFK